MLTGRKSLGALVVFVATILFVFQRADAGITAVGDISPADPATWTSSDTVYIGMTDGMGASLTVDGGSKLLSDIGYIGLNGSTGAVTIDGIGSSWEANSFWIGRKTISDPVAGPSSGSLTISNGATVSGNITSGWFYVGDKMAVPGTTEGHVVVTGSGSTLSARVIDVGHNGMMGTLLVENGGTAVFGQDGAMPGGLRITNGGDGTSGLVKVIGQGSSISTWGYEGVSMGGTGATVTNGTLLIADHGKVYANGYDSFNGGVRIVGGSANCTLNLRVSGDDMLVFGHPTNPGKITNNGKVNFYADAFLAGGTYAPISDSLGRAMAWSGTGTYNAFGGTWNSTTHQFIVAAATNAAAGSTQSISDYQRIIFTNAGGQQVGMSFGDVDAGATASASYMTAGDLASLSLSAGEAVLSGWNFTASGFGSEVLLSYNIGLGASDLEIWHYDGATWTSYSTDSLVYDSNGVASFTVTGFSGYAITGTPVPEPATMGLLILGAAAILRRRRSRK